MYVLTSQLPFSQKRNMNKSLTKGPKVNFKERKGVSIEKKTMKNLKKEKSKFYVSFSNIHNSHLVHTHQYSEEILSTTGLLMNFITKFYLKSEEIHEILFDFLRNAKHELVFLACSGYTLKNEPIGKSSLKLQQIHREPDQIHIIESFEYAHEEDELNMSYQSKDFYINNLVETIAFRASFIPKSKLKLPKVKDTLEESKNDYLELKNADKLGRIPFNMIKLSLDDKDYPIINTIEMTNGQPGKPTRGIDRIKSLCGIDKSRLDLVEKSQQIMEKEVKKINKAKASAAKAAHHTKNIKDVKELFESHNEAIMNSCRALYNVLLLDPILSCSFDQLSRGAADTLPERFYRSLKPCSIFTFKPMVKRDHILLGITRSGFERYCELFAEACRSNGLAQEAIEILITRVRDLGRKKISIYN